MTEEAKRCVESCHDWYQAFAERGKGEERTVKELLTTADLIESLSKQCDDQNEMLHWAYGILKKLDKGLEEHGFDSFEEVYAQLEQVTRERDAAIRDIDEAAPCFACIRFERNGGDCIGAHVCIDDILQDALGGKYADYYWQWRGVEVTNDAQKGSDAKS